MRQDNLRPDSERRLVLKNFAISEAELGRLRKLPEDDAAWRIRHECDEAIAWAKRRRDFVLGEVCPPKAKARPPATEIIVPHGGHGPRTRKGERI